MIAVQPSPGPRQPALRLVRPREPQPAETAPPAPRGAAGQQPPATADGEAMRQVYQLHGPVLTRFALKLTLGDQQRAEDIVQETLLRAWRHPEVVANGRQPIRPWLFTVARHVAIDLWRARSRAEHDTADEATDPADPAEPIEQIITALDIRAALGSLTADHRQVIIELYYHSRTVAETATTLRIPQGTVKSRAYYALRHLRHLITDPADDPTTPLRALSRAR
jgi:RNA polymerase sigma-70 factor, ECF subfamily